MDTPDSNERLARSQVEHPPFLAADPLTNRRELDTCSSAQSLSAWSCRLNCRVLVVLPCKRWSCRHCNAVKVRKYAWLVGQAAPNRLLTLTVDPKAWTDPETAYRATSKALPRLVRHLRSKVASVEYFRATEVTKKGWPHYHMLVRSPYIPQPVIKAEWERLTGALIVDVRQVKKSFEAYTYVVKYLAKLHDLPWGTRHIAWSRGFFPKKDKPAKNRYDLNEIERADRHPADVLSETYQGSVVTRVELHLYAIDLDPAISLTPSPTAPPADSPPPDTPATSSDRF